MSSSSILEKVSEEELLLLPHKDCVRFAVFCAEQVRDGWRGVPECVAAVETVERWLKGKASAEECRVAYYAAAAYYAATAYYATYAAYAAAYAYYTARAARAAHYATAGKPHLIDAQWDYYLELLHFDDIAEKLLLGETV